MKKLLRLLPVILYALITTTTAHPGAQDANGGHYVHTPGWGYEVGSYHYHGGNPSDSGVRHDVFASGAESPSATPTPTPSPTPAPAQKSTPAKTTYEIDWERIKCSFEKITPSLFFLTLMIIIIGVKRKRRLNRDDTIQTFIKSMVIASCAASLISLLVYGMATGYVNRAANKDINSYFGLCNQREQREDLICRQTF